MRFKVWRRFRQQKGQGLVEYILIIALVALVAVGALRLFGSKIQGWFKTSADRLDHEFNDTTSGNQ